MRSINAIHACVSVDEKGEEGIMAFFDGKIWIPLIASDNVRLDHIIKMAESVKRQSGIDYRVIQFSQRLDVSSEFKPI